MTKEELISQLKQILIEGWHEEDGHIEADKLLLKYINDKEITDAFQSIEKWYS